jgi:hypothetical protein
MMIEWWTRKREMEMKMRTMWRIQADMRNKYELPDCIGKASYRCYYTPDPDSYQPYQGW